jgi:alkylation response protein AidB-like acyl-CoA dehydrogenase
MIQKAARDFAENECKPGVIERDEKQIFPKEQVMKLADLGFLGMMVPPEYGGAGMDTVSYVLAMEEISKWDASTSVVMSVNNSLVCYGLEAFGSESKNKNILHRWHKVKRMVSYISAHLCLANRKQEVMQHRKEQLQKIKATIIY